MTPDQINQTMNLYGALMEEVKLRLFSISHCTSNQSGLLPPFVKEFCYLQIRMVCELMALGCLVAHGDIKETSTKGMQKLYEADKIMNALDDLHDEFYPIPIWVDRSQTEFLDVKPKASTLPKREFKTFYAKCGDSLHRGTLRKLLKEGRIPFQVSYPEIAARAQKIVSQLENHVVVMQGRERMLCCSLGAPGTNVVILNADFVDGHHPLRFDDPSAYPPET